MEIDEEAVHIVGKSGHIELKLVAKGDRLKLKAFCTASAMSTDKEEKTSKIKQILEQGKKAGNKMRHKPPAMREHARK